jgi:hypothetical protein
MFDPILGRGCMCVQIEPPTRSHEIYNFVGCLPALHYHEFSLQCTGYIINAVIKMIFENLPLFGLAPGFLWGTGVLKFTIYVHFISMMLHTKFKKRSQEVKKIQLFINRQWMTTNCIRSLPQVT